MEPTYRNYIVDNTRMPVPSAYFLQRLYDFDPMLVILPSRMKPGTYIIARRKQFGKGLTVEGIDKQVQNPDTKMCVLNGCVPVCLMFATGATWNPDPIIARLKARDIWAHGGADKVADMLEEQEEAERQATRAAIRDDIWNRSGAAYRSYKARTGQSTLRFHDYLPTKRTNSGSTGEVAAPNTTAGARSTAGSGDSPVDGPRLSAGAEPKVN